MTSLGLNAQLHHIESELKRGLHFSGAAKADCRLINEAAIFVQMEEIYRVENLWWYCLCSLP